MNRVIDALDPAMLAMISEYERRIDAKSASPTSAVESVSTDAPPRRTPNSAVESVSADRPELAATSAVESVSTDMDRERSVGSRHVPVSTLVDSWGAIYTDAQLVLSAALEETLALTCVREFLAEAAQGRVKILVISGPTGVGKTIAAVWTMLVATPPGKWQPERHPWLVAASKIARWGAFDNEAAREKLASSRVAVVDDLGAENPWLLPGFVTTLADLVNERAGAPGYTVITTNLDLDGLERRYASVDPDAWARIHDRFRQRAAWFDVDHASLRTR